MDSMDRYDRECCNGLRSPCISEMSSRMTQQESRMRNDHISHGLQTKKGQVTRVLACLLTSSSIAGGSNRETKNNVLQR